MWAVPEGSSTRTSCSCECLLEHKLVWCSEWQPEQLLPMCDHHLAIITWPHLTLIRFMRAEILVLSTALSPPVAVPGTFSAEGLTFHFPSSFPGKLLCTHQESLSINTPPLHIALPTLWDPFCLHFPHKLTVHTRGESIFTLYCGISTFLSIAPLAQTPLRQIPLFTPLSAPGSLLRVGSQQAFAGTWINNHNYFHLYLNSFLDICNSHQTPKPKDLCHSLKGFQRMFALGLSSSHMPGRKLWSKSKTVALKELCRHLIARDSYTVQTASRTT